MDEDGLAPDKANWIACTRHRTPLALGATCCCVRATFYPIQAERAEPLHRGAFTRLSYRLTVEASEQLCVAFIDHQLDPRA